MYVHSCRGTFPRISTATSVAVNPELCYILSLWMDGAFSCVAMLEPLLLTQVLGRDLEWVSTKPWPRCCLHRVCLQILRSHFLLFDFSPCLYTDSWMAYHSLSKRTWSHVCAHILPCAFRRASACISQHVCVCHVFGIVMSFHTPCHQLRLPVLRRGGKGGGVGWSRCRMWGSITALAALRLTNGLLLSGCDEPGAGANVSLLWHRSGCQQKAWHGVNEAWSWRKAAKCHSWAFAIPDMRHSSSLIMLPVPNNHRWKI